MNFYLCHGTVDMRKGIVSLSELVRRNLKILRHGSNGYVLYWKKLDRERFLLPVFNTDTDRYEISWGKLVVLLQGIVRKELLVG